MSAPSNRTKGEIVDFLEEISDLLAALELAIAGTEVFCQRDSLALRTLAQSCGEWLIEARLDVEAALNVKGTLSHKHAEQAEKETAA